MKCNVATYLLELPNVKISDFKTYFQLTYRDILCVLKNKILMVFFENDTDAANCCLENILVLNSGNQECLWKVGKLQFINSLENAVQKQNLFSNTE